MQFLLLLSALLSAVTGAFAGPRVVAEQVSRSEAQVVAESPAARAELPVLVLVPGATPRAAAAVALPATPVLPIAAMPLTDVRLDE